MKLKFLLLPLAALAAAAPRAEAKPSSSRCFMRAGNAGSTADDNTIQPMDTANACQ